MSKTKSNEIMLTRVYDAPLKLVWDAWTDLKHIEKWWGPRGFTLTTQSKELKAGGKWIYTMHGPDGTDYPNIATYHEVVPLEKLVYDHGGNAERQKLFTVTATFREENGKTVLTIISAFDDAEAAKAAKAFIKSAGGNATWDRLGEFLEEKYHGKDPFIIQRSFDTDIKTMFSIWQNPESLAQMLGPKGAQTKFLRTDVREGGQSLWEMTIQSKAKHGVLVFDKIKPYSAFIYRQTFSDKDGKFTKAPHETPYPDQLLTTVEFFEEEPRVTRVSVRWDIVGSASEAEKKGFDELKPIMTTGWNESFDKVDERIR